MKWLSVQNNIENKRWESTLLHTEWIPTVAISATQLLSCIPQLKHPLSCLNIQAVYPK